VFAKVGFGATNSYRIPQPGHRYNDVKNFPQRGQGVTWPAIKYQSIISSSVARPRAYAGSGLAFIGSFRVRYFELFISLSLSLYLTFFDIPQYELCIPAKQLLLSSNSGRFPLADKDVYPLNFLFFL
jgi:hypothetical protein